MSNNSPPLAARPSHDLLSSEKTMWWTLWYTYGAFYFCRSNISAAVPGLRESVEAGGLGLTATQIGSILAATKIAYAVGQLVNGQFSEQLAPRKLLAIGMFGTALLNVLFGFGTGLYFLIFIWACNGYTQSLGWTPCVRVLVNWIPVERRGKVMGFVGTGYQVTAAATYVISGSAAAYFGWRGALFVPAGIMAASGVIMLLFLEERPPARNEGSDVLPDGTSRTQVPLSTGSQYQTPQQTEALVPGPPTNAAKNSVFENFVITLSNPALWLLGISLGLLNACRYGFLDWGLTHLIDIQGTGVGMAGLKYAVLPLGAIAGAYLGGWATDRFFGSRRGPVICILLVALALLTLVYDSVARASVPGSMVLLVLIGFCI